MGKLTGRKRKLNYKPIIWVAAVALPVVIAVASLVWPKPPVTVVFEQSPTADGKLSTQGTFQLTWQTNVETSGVVYYRGRSDRPYQQMVCGVACRHVVAIPATPGQKIELYVETGSTRGQGITAPAIEVVAWRPRSTTVPDNVKTH